MPEVRSELPWSKDIMSVVTSTVCVVVDSSSIIDYSLVG